MNFTQFLNENVGKSQYDFYAYEDNHGGLYLKLCKGNIIKFIFSGYENKPGSLAATILELYNGVDPHLWNDSDIDLYKHIIEGATTALIADKNGLYINDMRGNGYYDLIDSKNGKKLQSKLEIVE